MRTKSFYQFYFVLWCVEAQHIAGMIAIIGARVHMALGYLAVRKESVRFMTPLSDKSFHRHRTTFLPQDYDICI